MLNLEDEQSAFPRRRDCPRRGATGRPVGVHPEDGAEQQARPQNGSFTGAYDFITRCFAASELDHVVSAAVDNVLSRRESQARLASTARSSAASSPSGLRRTFLPPVDVI